MSQQWVALQVGCTGAFRRMKLCKMGPTMGRALASAFRVEQGSLLSSYLFRQAVLLAAAVIWH